MKFLSLYAIITAPVLIWAYFSNFGPMECSILTMVCVIATAKIYRSFAAAKAAKSKPAKN